MTSAVILYYTPIIQVAGLRLLPSYYAIHQLSRQLVYDFCSRIIQYTHYPRSWITTSTVILYYTPIIPVAGLRLLQSYYTIHPGSWIMTSTVILYNTPIIRVAGLRLLQSYNIIHPLSEQLDYDFCRHIILYTHYPGSWIATSAVILYNTNIIQVAGLRLLQSYYTIPPLSGQLNYDFCIHMTVYT